MVNSIFFFEDPARKERKMYRGTGICIYESVDAGTSANECLRS